MCGLGLLCLHLLSACGLVGSAENSSDANPAGADAGPIDANPGGADAGPLDAGPIDAGPIDANPAGADAGPLDAGAPDAGALDTGAPDAGRPLFPTPPGPIVYCVPGEELPAVPCSPTTSSCPSRVLREGRWVWEFDGMDDHIPVDLTNSQRMALASEYTISGWVQLLRELENDRYYHAIAIPFGNGHKNSLELFHRRGALRAIQDSADPPARLVYPTEALRGDRLHHVAVVFDGAELCLFVDGVDEGCATASAPVFDAQPLLVGADSDSGQVTAHFLGAIGGLCLVSRAATPVEIRGLAQTP